MTVAAIKATYPHLTNQKIEQGVFLDGTVEGLSYRSGNLSGLTDANGTFDYEVGQDVAFFVGDIALGSAKGSPVITPQQLVPEVTGESINTVVNLMHFLLSIDEDANPDNGYSHFSRDA